MIVEKKENFSTIKISDSAIKKVSERKNTISITSEDGHVIKITTDEVIEHVLPAMKGKFPILNMIS